MGRYISAAGILVVGATASLVVLNPSDFASQLGDDLPWAISNVPFFECDDSDITDAYYFRWTSFRRHINATGAHWPGASSNGYVVTEFLPPVSWAGPFNSIVDAAGHHFRDGRWLRDHDVTSDYAYWWFSPNATNVNQYTHWLQSAILDLAAVTGNASLPIDLLGGFVENYLTRNAIGYLSEDDCWYQKDDNDAMETSISGNGCRPTIQAAMYANMRAIAATAQLVGNASLYAQFDALANHTQARMLELLWNSNITSFAVYKNVQKTVEVDSKPKMSESAGLAAPVGVPPPGNVTCPPAWPTGQLVSVRELLGLSSPWYWGVIPHGDDAVAKYAQSWAQLGDPQGFLGRWGPRTAERRHPCYNYSSWTTAHECNWDGPSWPYETSRVLTGLANMLQDYPGQQDVMKPADFVEQLSTYARAHTQSTAINGTRPWIGEDLHPDDGYWIAREIMYAQNRSSRNRGQWYLHSSYIDVVISGFLGVRPSLGDTWVLNPLVSAANASVPGGSPPGSMAYFALDNVLYHGHNVSIAWDVDGTRYGLGAGLKVWCDGARIVTVPSLANVTVNMGDCPQPADPEPAS